jgi:hypothetical protein
VERTLIESHPRNYKIKFTWVAKLVQDKELESSMERRLMASIVIFGLLLTSACSTNSDSEINPQTGMPEFLCPKFKDLLENANKEVWDLAAFKTSVTSAQDAVLEVMSDAATISVVSEQPASGWLRDINENGRDFLNYFGTSSESTSEDLIQIYGRWKANYELTRTYCP